VLDGADCMLDDKAAMQELLEQIPRSMWYLSLYPIDLGICHSNPLQLQSDSEVAF
jgi:hypothetical protein